MNMSTDRLVVRRSSRLLVVAGIAMSMVWFSGTAGCAGKKRAMKQREAEAALARENSNDSLDLESLARNQGEAKSAREVLYGNESTAWNDAPASGGRGRKGTPVGTARNQPAGNEIYYQEPLVLDAPGAGENESTSTPPTKRRGNRTTASNSPATPTTQPIASARELAANEAAVNAPVAITPGVTAAPIDPNTSITDISATPVRSRDALAAELARALRTEAFAGTPSYRQGVSLLALDMIQPGAVSSEITVFTQNLPPNEASSFESLRSLFSAIGTGGDASVSTSSDTWDTARLKRAIEQHLGVATVGETISIRTAALCTSVDGFGRYTPYSSTTFVRGRVTPAIVYLALDHVAQSQTGGQGDWSIDLVQSAKLYHDSDNLVVTDLGEQTVKDTSRDQRRDFCIARRIDLPANLSLGRYNLKVSVREPSNGATAEATIPIQIVADQGLTKK